MFVRFEDNPNSGYIDDRVWNEHGSARPVSHVLRTRGGKDVWCPITGVNEKGEFIPAMGIKVEDSGDAMCWLIYGGLWGVRLAPPDEERKAKSDERSSESLLSPRSSLIWSLDDASQWGEGFLLLPSSGADVRFA